MSKLIAYQDNEKIVLVDGTTIEIDTGMFNDPLGFIVTDAAQPTLAGGLALESVKTCALDFGGYACSCGKHESQAAKA